jgi:carbon storage regulator
MLVLSRKVDEQIIIGDNLRITVVSIRGHQVRLGFEAPPSVSIFREELCRESADHPLMAAPNDGAECQPKRQALVLVGSHEG